MDYSTNLIGLQHAVQIKWVCPMCSIRVSISTTRWLNNSIPNATLQLTTSPAAESRIAQSDLVSKLPGGMEGVLQTSARLLTMLYKEDHDAVHPECRNAMILTLLGSMGRIPRITWPSSRMI